MSSPLDEELNYLRKLAAQAAEDSRPEPALLDDHQLLVLIDYLNSGMHGCDHTLAQTQVWLSTQDLLHPVEDILRWLVRRGGGCDCEVAANLFDRLEYLRPQPSRPQRKQKRNRDARSLQNAGSWKLDALPKPWRIANMYCSDPIRLQMGKKGGCTLTIIEEALPIDTVDDDSQWTDLWHDQPPQLPESKVIVEYSAVELPNGLMSVTTSSPGWTPVFTWVFADPGVWYVRVETESNRRIGDFLQISALIAEIHGACKDP